MPSILPENFPLQQLPPTEQFKLEAYYDRFVIKRYREYGMGHLWLACYAALPAVMTPDLLYKIWMNFSSYHDGKEMRIHHVAVSDLLLSPLFQEISYETYEMPVEVKNGLLQFWQNELQNGNFHRLAKLEEVAKFLLGYTKVFRTNDAKSDDAFREAQAVTAWSYLDTQRASAMLLQSLEQASKKALDENSGPLARAEQLRLLEVARLTSQRHDLGLMADGQSKPTNIEVLAGYSQQLQSLLAGKEEDILHILQQSGSDMQLMDNPGPGIAIKAPTALVNKTQPETAETEKGNIYLLLAGINDYPSPGLQLRGCLNDVQNFKAAVEQLGYQAHIQLLTDREVTKSVLEEALQAALSSAKEGDQVLFFFAGHTTRLEGCNLVLFDSNPKQKGRGLSLQEIFSIYGRIAGDYPYLTILLDTELETLEIPHPNIAVITGGGMEEAGGSRFMNNLLPIWTRSKGRLSLQKLIAAVRNQMSTNSSSTTNTGNTGSYGNTAYQSIGYGGTSTTRSDGTDRLPDLYASPAIASQPLIQTSQLVRQMQVRLRSLGYYNGSTNNIYNQETDTALRAWLAEKNLGDQLSPDTILYHLEKEKEEREQTEPKFMLFVFSNPNGGLPFVGDEQERIYALADDIERYAGAELIVLFNPSAEELRTFFTAPGYRNQLILFHFSGYESDPAGDGLERGIFLQKDGEKALIDYGELHHWLDFQENIRLFYLNTCHSSGLAKLLTIRGVRAAVGAPGLVEDKYASNFAIEFYQNMLKGWPLREAFDHISLEPVQGQHRMNAPGSGVKFLGFQIFYDWGRKEEAKHWAWIKTEEKAQATSAHERKTATSLYLETLKELFNKGETEVALNSFLQLNQTLQLRLEGDLQRLRSDYLDQKVQLEKGMINSSAFQRSTAQILNSIIRMIEETPRRMAMQESSGTAKWVDFFVPWEKDLGNFEQRSDLLDFLIKSLEAIKSIGKVTLSDSSYSLGFLMENDQFICNAHLLSDRKKAEKAKVEFWFPRPSARVNPENEFAIQSNSFQSNQAEDLDYAVFKLHNIQPASNLSETVIPADEMPKPLPVERFDIPKPGEKVFIFRRTEREGNDLRLIATEVIAQVGNYLFYRPDELTIGISGTPVFNANLKVVAINLAAKMMKQGDMVISASGEMVSADQGVLMAAILHDLEEGSGKSGSYAY